MSTPNPPVGPTARAWAEAPLRLTKVEQPNDPEKTIYELTKIIVVNGVPHMQMVWLNQQQLRGIGIDHGL